LITIPLPTPNIPAENITSKDVYDAAVQGDKLAQEIFEFTGNISNNTIASGLENAIASAKASPKILPVNSKISCASFLNIYKGKTKLLVSELKDSDAAVLGASALAWELKDLAKPPNNTIASGLENAIASAKASPKILPVNSKI